jgi:hypothetical protein
LTVKRISEVPRFKEVRDFSIGRIAGEKSPKKSLLGLDILGWVS